MSNSANLSASRFTHFSGSKHKKKSKAPNVYEFMKFIQKKIYVHPFKTKRKLKNVSQRSLPKLMF